jgi:hypothetical protein
MAPLTQFTSVFFFVTRLLKFDVECAHDTEGLEIDSSFESVYMSCQCVAQNNAIIKGVSK